MVILGTSTACHALEAKQTRTRLVLLCGLDELISAVFLVEKEVAAWVSLPVSSSQRRARLQTQEIRAQTGKEIERLTGKKSTEMESRKRGGKQAERQQQKEKRKANGNTPTKTL